MRKLALIILDGWGIGKPGSNNAIHVANTPYFDSLWSQFPHTTLQASGEYVGLPEGQIGGSEVGHITMGAGRILYRELPRINKSLSDLNSDTSILNIPEFKDLLTQGKRNPLHLVGLFSTGGVHSHMSHLLKMLEIFKEQGLQSPWIHVITDGRDTPPNSSKEFLQKLFDKILELNFGRIATVSGRLYTMDRDNNLDRTQKAIDAMVHAKSSANIHLSDDVFKNVRDAIDNSYSNGLTDEFILPVVVNPAFKGIQLGEPMFFWNFRTDRMKQITREIHKELPDNPLTTMTNYDKSYTFPVLFKKEEVRDTLGEVISRNNLRQLKAAETEKYAHVTYFFNGGVEVVFDGEHRSLADSNKVLHDQMPEMQVAKIVDNVHKLVEEQSPDFVVVNIANSDMLGHTGNFQAVIHSIQTVDAQLKRLMSYLSEKNYICIITADHGNAEYMYDQETKEIHTAHTMNPVPFIVVDFADKNNQHLTLKQDPTYSLDKVAGTIVQLMDLHKGGALNFDSLIHK